MDSMITHENINNIIDKQGCEFFKKYNKIFYESQYDYHIIKNNLIEQCNKNHFHFWFFTLFLDYFLIILQIFVFYYNEIYFFDKEIIILIIILCTILIHIFFISLSHYFIKMPKYKFYNSNIIYSIIEKLCNKIIFPILFVVLYILLIIDSFKEKVQNDNKWKKKIFQTKISQVLELINSLILNVKKILDIDLIVLNKDLIISDKETYIQIKVNKDLLNKSTESNYILKELNESTESNYILKELNNKLDTTCEYQLDKISNININEDKKITIFLSKSELKPSNNKALDDNKIYININEEISIINKDDLVFLIEKRFSEIKVQTEQQLDFFSKQYFEENNKKFNREEMKLCLYYNEINQIRSNLYNTINLQVNELKNDLRFFEKLKINNLNNPFKNKFKKNLYLYTIIIFIIYGIAVYGMYLYTKNTPIECLIDLLNNIFLELNNIQLNNIINDQQKILKYCNIINSEIFCFDDLNDILYDYLDDILYDYLDDILYYI